MAVNGGRRLPSFDQFASGSSSPSSQPGDRLKAFLNMLASRQRLMPRAAAKPKSDSGLDLSQRLAPCCERTLDAYTVEDALNRHERAVEQLTMAIEHVAQSNLPADSKRDAMFELMHHRVMHAECIVTLNAIIVREEQFVWQPE